jgi:hypothetical protein
MDSRELGAVMRKAIVARGFARRGSHLYRWSPELIWAVALQKSSRHGQHWYVNVGILVRSLHPGIEYPRENDCDIQIRYESLPGPVPPAATGSRLPERIPYFTMVHELTHDMVDDAERIEATEFMADDLANLAGSISTVDDLAERYAENAFRSGYVARNLREMLESRSGKTC